MADTKKKSYYNISKVADTMTRQDGKGAGKKIMKDLNGSGCFPSREFKKPG